MSEKNTLRIRIFGIEYNLKGESDPATMMELAQIVDQKMREMGQPGSAPTHRIAILAAFHLADELLKTRKLLDNERQRQDQVARSAANLDLRMQGILGESAALPGKSETDETAEVQPDLPD